MAKGTMTKQEEFLWIVQTVIIANNIHIATEKYQTDNDRHDVRHIFSATGTFIVCDEAIRASNRIPEKMSARIAANQFLTFTLSNLKEIEEEARSERMECPHWFMRFGAEPEDLE